MYADRTDLSCLPETDELPRPSGVGGFVHTATDDDVAADRRAAGADVDHIGVRFGNIDGPDRTGLDLPIADRRPRLATVLGFPHTAACAAHVEGARLASNAGNRGHASAAGRPDIAPPQILPICVFAAAVRGAGYGVRLLGPSPACAEQNCEHERQTNCHDDAGGAAAHATDRGPAFLIDVIAVRSDLADHSSFSETPENHAARHAELLERTRLLARCGAGGNESGDHPPFFGENEGDYVIHEVRHR